MSPKIKQVAVIGASKATDEEILMAHQVGSLLAKYHFTLLSGGRTGVMEASCRGSKESGGFTIGILPENEGNPYLDVEIRTGMGQARNVILTQSADVIIAIGGEYGTLSEIAHALKSGITVYGIHTWDIPGIIHCFSAEEVILRILS